MAFSPQSDKLAIAQSDNMVFVYKIGVDWGEKKSICNKFQHSSSITTLIWPVGHANEIVYGLAEGQVKLGQMKTHRPVTLYNADSYVLALSSGSDGSGFVSSHVDGSIYVYYYEAGDRGARRIARHSCPPFALSWGTSIIVAGNDGKIVFYDSDGSEEQTLDISSGDERREYTCAVCNPTGDSVVLGSFDRLTAVTKSRETMNWEVSGTVNVENLYSVSAMDWKPDGDKVAVGNICGVVDLYDVCIKRALYKGGFELTYVSSSQIIIRQVDSNLRIVLRSRYNREILKTNIYQSRFVIAHTSDTLLLGDLETLKVSEIPWRGIELGEKFIFDNPSACIIHCAGELSIIEYGIDDILGTVRTSFISSHVISLRINERKRKVSHQADADNKKIAFLLDAQTVCIKDMCSQVTVQVSHDSKIDWLELNGRGDLLLFRDKKRYLHVFNLQTQTRHQLLSFCTYVQWVPNSDVIVAQSRTNMCVWYNVGAPDQVTTIPIKGDIEDIERTEGKTEVIVDEGINQALYPLDEALISFSTAIEDGEHFKAMELLDKLVLSPDVEAMWRQLRSASLSAGEVKIAQRCSAALGDITASKFLGNICDMGRYAEQDLKINRDDYYQVRCNLALLEKDYRAAEDILVNQGKIDECIELYQKLQRHEDAIRVAQQNKHPDLHDMRRAYFQYLLDTNQYENAAVLKATESDFTQAVDLFLKGGMPGKAAQVLLDHDIQQPMSLLDKVANALVRSGMHDIAGEFFERQNDLPRALESYIRGNAFRKAVDLARKSFPARVVELQEAWGDYLVSIKQIDMAINHYIEAKVNRKAIDAALNARQYSRALQLVDAIDRETARPFYRQLARHYEETRQYDLAQKCYVEGDQAQLAVEMHTKVGNWELAHSIAKKHMREEEVSMLYISQAQKLEAKGRLKDAEKLYLAVKEKDLAVNMYKKHKLYDDMIRLVQEYMPETLKESHKFLATTLEMEGLYKDAEHHYVEAQEWHGAVNMYRHIEQWDDAIRVAKFHGGIGACKRVTIALLMAVGTVEGAKYLIKHGLVEAAIDHAAENGAYDLALELATQQMPKKLPDVYLKHALLLEDDEKFDKAEEEFLKAGKPKEAIDMYLHQHDWENALRVAENFDSSSVPAVFLAHAAVCVESKDFSKAEELFLAASRPDLALSMYQDAEMLPDAIRIAQKYLPHRAAELNASFNTSQARAGKASVKTDFMVIGRSMEQSKQWAQALEVYLSARAGKVDPSIDVEELWERAVEIARKYVTNRYVEVGVEVSRRLVDMKKEEAAADLLFEVGRQDEAINLCIQSRKFDKAKSLAKGNAMLKKKVDEAYQGFLITREDTKELVELGHSEDALNVLVKRGDWDGLWSMASKENVSQSTLSKYVLMRVEEVRCLSSSRAIRCTHRFPRECSCSEVPISMHSMKPFNFSTDNSRRPTSPPFRYIGSSSSSCFYVPTRRKDRSTYQHFLLYGISSSMSPTNCAHLTKSFRVSCCTF